MFDVTRTTVSGLGEIFDGPHATPERRSEGAHFLNIASLRSGRLDLNLSDRVSEEDFQQWTRRVTPRAGDLLFSYETRLGEAALMPEGVRACLGRRMALLRPDTDVVNPRFLLYLYLSPGFQNTIAKHTIHGATVPRIGLATMGEWEIEVPSLPRQQAVSEVLGALDDKIVANQRVAAAAESVIGWHAGRAMSTTTLAQIAEHSTASLRTEEFDQRVAHFSLPAFDDGGMPELCAGESVKSNKFRIEAPCVLMSKLNPRIPRIWDVVTVPDVQAIASTEFVILVPHGIGTTLLWALLVQPQVTTTLTGKVAGTSGSHQRVRPAEIMSLSIGDPASLSSSSRELIDMLGRRRAATVTENKSLAATRDALLPLLMSGRLTVKDAEKTVEEVL